MKSILSCSVVWNKDNLRCTIPSSLLSFAKFKSNSRQKTFLYLTETVNVLKVTYRKSTHLCICISDSYWPCDTSNVSQSSFFCCDYLSLTGLFFSNSDAHSISFHPVANNTSAAWHLTEMCWILVGSALILVLLVASGLLGINQSSLSLWAFLLSSLTLISVAYCPPPSLPSPPSPPLSLVCSLTSNLASVTPTCLSLALLHFASYSFLSSSLHPF